MTNLRKYVSHHKINSFDTKSQTCIYNKGEQCKPPLANALVTTVAFLLGALTSVLSGFLEMKIATYANARTLEARKGVGKAFVTAFHSGAAMGFLLAGNGLLPINPKSITGYVLGGSSVALFGKVGGEIYTKAADVEVEQNIPEESSKPSCKFLYCASSDYWDCHSHLCCFTNKLSLQSLTRGTRKLSKIGTYSFVFPLLVAGLAIRYTTEYYTSNAYSSLRDVADCFRIGAATNLIFRLALGYNSVILPIFSKAIAIYVSFNLAAMYGVPVAAL
ncbi:hypothetical protein POM88_005225 [Heracleum sosnowskyi]|uniref:H(+)-exporting diphosphatase n=1 Tax=Heracleum sosnowskyi TaxID=360622 RepID=A0AAD8JJI1_9APIA|nr:hypothetical protein POM88_005225 [Heracleum sosnowskyi]